MFIGLFFSDEHISINKKSSASGAFTGKLKN